MHRRLALGWVALLAAQPAPAWSPNTHMATAREVRNDVIDDGRITIVELIRADDGTVTRQELGSLAIDPAMVEAIRHCEHEFHAGSCCADAYPDMYVGQSVIHAFVPGQPWRAIDWARHVLRCAREYGDPGSPEREKALAFAAGWFVHVAGDAFGHTHVNQYAGGAWDWGDMDIVLKHVSYESYINTKIPGAADETLRRLDADGLFIAETLMLHEAVQPALEDAPYLKALVDYHEAFAEAAEAIDEVMDATGGGIFGNDVAGCLNGLGPALDFCEQQRDNSHRALMEWGETSTRVIRDVTEGQIPSAISAVNQWVGYWTPKLILAIPGGAEEAAHYLGAPMDWITMPLSDLMEQTLVWAFEHVIRSTFEDIVNPVDFMLAMHGEAVRAEVDALMGVTLDHPELDPLTFEPYHDTVVLAKLALLDRDGLIELGNLLGVDLRVGVWTDDENILYDCIESLDASNQLYLPPTFKLLLTPELEERAFRRLFLTEPWAPPASRLDPAHVIVFAGLDGRTIAFGASLTAAGEGLTFNGYVLRAGGGNGALLRHPIFSVPVPPVTDGSTPIVWGTWEIDQPGRQFFHLACSRMVPGNADPEEDSGIDLQLMLQPGGGTTTVTPPGTEGMGDPDQYRDLLLQTIAAMEQMLPDLPPAQQALLQERIAELRQRLEDAGTTPPPDDQSAWTGLDDAFVYPEELLTNIVDMWNETVGETEPNELRPAVGRVVDAAGQPVPDALVTVVDRVVFDTLRAATGVPRLRFDLWLEQHYLMGRTNEAGRFMVGGVAEGEYVAVVSAPGLPRCEQPLPIVFGATHGVLLPDLVISDATAQAAAPPGGGDPAGLGQHAATPGFDLRPATTVIDHDAINAVGDAETTVLLRPRAGFSGPVELRVDDVPEGVAAELSENPVELSEPREVVITWRGRATVGRQTARLTATGGDLVREVPLLVTLDGGEARLDPELPTLAPGGATVVRLSWDGPADGRAAIARLGEPPDGLTVRAVRLRSNRLLDELDLTRLTPARLAERDRVLRADDGMPAPRRELRLDPADCRRVPTTLPTAGLLLPPEGYVDLELRASRDLPPGEYRLPLTVLRGAETIDRELIVTVE